MTTEAKTKYRVWTIVNIPNKAAFEEVESPEAGARFIHDEAMRQLGDPGITSNTFGLLVLEDGEWCEWYDEEGDDVDALEERLFPYPCACHPRAS